MINIENSNVFSFGDDTHGFRTIEQEEVRVANMHSLATFQD